jgi:hypothetical protein
MAPVTDTLPFILLLHQSYLLPLHIVRCACFYYSCPWNAIGVLVPAALAVHATADLKARCFDYLANLLCEHSSLYSSAALIATFNHIPGSSYNATLESAVICSSICSAFSTLDSLVGLGCCTHQDTPITASITTDPTTRHAGISYFAFRSTIDPALIDTRVLLPKTNFEIWLPLPQSISPTDTRISTSLATRNLLTAFETPPRAPSPKMLQTAADLHALDAISLDYTTKRYTLFTHTQLQTLLLHTPTTPAPPAHPRMTAILAPSVTSGSSYLGSLNFLDSQSAFDLTFPNPVPLLITTSPTTGVSIDSHSIGTSIDSLSIGTSSPPLLINEHSTPSLLSSAPIMLALLTAMTPLH